MAAEENSSAPCIEVDAAFLKSIRGLLKIAEMVILLVSFIFFTSASRAKFIAATGFEFSITGLLLLLYSFKLNKKLTFFFWPLIDVFNSVIAMAFMLIMGLMAVSTYTHKSILGGGILGIIAALLLGVDGYTLFRKITFNRMGNRPQTQYSSKEENHTEQ